MTETDKTYLSILQDLKEKIRLARQKAAIAVNIELLMIYWEIGNTIVQQQKQKGWGKKVIEKLAKDLKSAFPDMKGLSKRNLVYMQTFASAWPNFPIPQPPELQVVKNQRDIITQQLVAQLQNVKNKDMAFTQVPLAQLQNVDNHDSVFSQGLLAKLTWSHHITLLDKVKDPQIRLFYVCKAIENGWSRNVMLHHIEGNLYNRLGKAITNFESTLPKSDSDLAKETLRNPYVFDFLGITEEMHEQELEKALIQHIKKFLLELGRGFAYVGNQYNLQVENDEYFLDLLFFNYHLNCFVVFELKIGAFKPEYAGKLNFYINIIDEQIKVQHHKPTIGVLLCKTPNKTVVKYALKGIGTPIGIAEYELINALPKQLKSEMPTVEELEQELEKEMKIFSKPVDDKRNNLKGMIERIKNQVTKK